ncbi:hypothetical protein [Chryseobacterium sp. CFBP8996]|uniref:hypothetical protein n=1 Tax=Chryseobacterium sp. CFBP8996 TaxID=3096529 RepID=UPI002A6A2AD5|nr:hypothetical protein [Chryseobacterium sp. CFBP8996]MDY0930801.1 hypothetical protein [Chryseobacterium sp. CFBP8996]
MKNISVTHVGISHYFGNSPKEFEKNILENLYIKRKGVLTTTIEEPRLESYYEENEIRRIDSFSKYLFNANIDIDNCENIPDKSKGIIINTIYNSYTTTIDFIKKAIEKGEDKASPLLFPYTVPNAATGLLTMNKQFRGYNNTIGGYSPVLLAMDKLKEGNEEYIVCGGVDEINDYISTYISKKNRLISDGACLLGMSIEEENKNKLFTIIQGKTQFFNKISSKEIRKYYKQVLNDINLQDIDLVVSFCQDGKSKQIEREVIKGNKKIVYYKELIGSVLGAEDSICLFLGAILLKKNQAKRALINVDSFGGNINTYIIEL